MLQKADERSSRPQMTVSPLTIEKGDFNLVWVVRRVIRRFAWAEAQGEFGVLRGCHAYQQM